MIIIGAIMLGLAVAAYCACAIGSYDPNEFQD